jgi:hypothetical protein
MSAFRYNNFTEFYNDYKMEFSNSQNQRLVNLFNTIANLGKGCGCTRRKRTQFCSLEYRKVGEILTPQNIQLMKMKHPMMKLEFAEVNAVFHVIDV